MAETGDEDERPDDVELLLDCQRPCLIEGAQRPETDEGDHPVSGVEDDRHSSRDERPTMVEATGNHKHQDTDPEERGDQRRKKTLRATAVEGASIDAAVEVPLLEQQRRDQEATKHEKHVESDEATAETRAAVRESDQHDAQRAHPVVGGAIAKAADVPAGDCGHVGHVFPSCRSAVLTVPVMNGYALGRRGQMRSCSACVSREGLWLLEVGYSSARVPYFRPKKPPLDVERRLMQLLGVKLSRNWAKKKPRCAGLS